MTKKQRLASERNWRIAQIKGILSGVQGVNISMGKDLDVSKAIGELEDLMLKKNDEYWQRQKKKLCK